MTEAPLLAVQTVARRYPGRIAVEEASFQLRPGRVACLLGPSGCGKSTMLRMIAGLEPVDDGEIAIGGHIMSNRRAMTAPEHRGVGLVFQDNALFPHLNVSDNIGFGLTRLPAPERRNRIAALLARFHIEHLAKAWPHMLSGGEQQRVAIARALAREPALLLLDEPFSGLDTDLRASVRQSLLADLSDLGATVLVVTHDPEEAMMIGDDLILMSEGRVLQTGSPQHCYRRPVSSAAARLLGDAILLQTSVAHGIAQTPFGPLPAPAIPDGMAQMIIRPEMLKMDQTGAAATVEEVCFAGRNHRIELRLGDLKFALLIPGDPPREGSTLMLTIAAEAAHFIAA